MNLKTSMQIQRLKNNKPAMQIHKVWCSKIFGWILKLNNCQISWRRRLNNWINKGRSRNEW